MNFGALFMPNQDEVWLMIRPAKSGEKYGKHVINNFRKNKHWAVKIFPKSKKVPTVELVCVDGVEPRMLNITLQGSFLKIT